LAARLRAQPRHPWPLQVLYYSAAFFTGLHIQYGTSWWFGHEAWQENLFSDHDPATPHRALVKVYYLIQLAFWVSMIFITLIEPWRSDTLFMIVHHLITTFLVGGSYLLDHIRIGTAILVEQDLADIFLPLAKSFRYLGMLKIGDFFFGCFAVAWYPTRHYLFFYLYQAIVVYYPKHCSAVNWNPIEGSFTHENLYPIFLTVLALFQCLLLRWGIVDIGPAVFKAIFSGATGGDHRSDDEKSADEKGD
jgi:acyl-CoA-dependent ceramide synthase